VNNRPLTFEDLELFQRENEIHTISLAYVQNTCDVKNMSPEEFQDACNAVYDRLYNRKD
jgi:hypothetical protein